MTKRKLWSKIVESLRDLNFEARDKKVRIKKLDESILTKAEAIGVGEIICLENETRSESEIKIEKVDKDEWGKLR